MLLTPWLRIFAARLSYVLRFGARPASRRGRPLAFERLEDRTLLSTLTVNTIEDDNTRDTVLTLREAAAVVNGTLAFSALTAGEQAQVDLTDPLGTNDIIGFDPAGVPSAVPILLQQGQIDLTADVTISGNGDSGTIIDAVNVTRIFFIDGTGVDVNLFGLLLRNGRTTGDKVESGDTTFHGGAIRSLSTGSLTITSSTLTGNSTTGIDASGGAIFSQAGTLTIESSTLIGNQTTNSYSGGHGGAIFKYAGNISITDSTIDGNSTSGNFSRGGAIFSSSGSVTITNSDVTNNSTPGTIGHGGAIFNSSNLVTVVGSNVSGNSTSGDSAKGGAIYTYSTSGVTIVDSTLSGNSTSHALAPGGAIWSRGSVRVTGSTLTDNSTLNADGGAIYSLSTVVLTNSTLSDNEAASDSAGTRGGGAFSLQGMTITNSTIVNNDASFQGGGLASSGGTMAIRNSILAGNNAGSGDYNEILSQGTLSVAHSLIGINNGTGLAATVGSTPDANGNFVGTGASPLDPLLGPLAFNGGPTQTHALLSGSLALDSGDNALAVDPSNSNAALTSDQRGAPFARVFGAAVDMGAFEAQAVTFLVDNPNDESDGDFSPGDLSLREAVELANLNTGVADIITFASSLDGTPLLLTEGQIEITDSLTITGNGQTETVIDAQQGSRIFLVADVTGSDPDLVLDSLTLQNGRTSAFQDHGGAIRSNGTDNTIFIRNSVVTNNVAAGANSFGGAVYAYNGVEITGSAITNNATDGGNAGRGGAIFVANGGVSITGSIVSGNVADGNQGEGGALHIESGGVSIVDSTIRDNSTNGVNGHGGAIFVHGGATIINSSLRDNFTTGAQSAGGALDSSGGDVIVINSTFSGNSTTGTGLGSAGGAISTDHNPLTLINSTLSNNASYGRGGGIDAGQTVTLINSTVVDNRSNADDGGGIYSQFGPVTIHNSIVARNSDAGTNPDISTGGTLDVQHSLIGDNTGTSLIETGSITPDGNGNFIGDSSSGGVIDPGLGPLAFNGGLTLTHALLAGSLAIDSGDDALAVDPTNGNAALATDQRGAPFVRSFGSAVDMGAFEVQTLDAALLVVDNATDEFDGDFSDGDRSLREVIALANASAGHDIVTFATTLSGTPLLLDLGQIEITDSLTITGNGQTETVIDAQQLSRIFDVAGDGTDLTLDSLTLRNGRTTDSSSAGGAIRSLATATSSITIVNSAVSNNSTGGSFASGGALFSSSGAIVVTGSTFTGNYTEGTSSYGGAIASHSATSDLSITSSLISDNQTSGDFARGGGVYFRGSAGFSGGIVFITNSTLSGNATLGTFGLGGGIYSRESDVVVTNATLTNNESAEGYGGAINAYNASADVTIHNSIVAGNTDAGSHPELRVGGTLTIEHSLIGDNTGTGLSATSGNTPDANGNFIGSGASPIDPLLGPLAFNGGPTQTHALLAGSLALDSGDDDLAVDPTNGNAALATDQRGAPFVRSF
ncbi:MAG: hypothetical protein KDA75_08895, partial [Planctomycetaceae bacterium]|nr:hypothetical protein [Planctomycetaceae bacterium]